MIKYTPKFEPYVTYYFSNPHQLNAFKRGMNNAWSFKVDEHNKIHSIISPHELIEMAFGEAKEWPPKFDWDKVSELLTFFEVAVANNISLSKMVRLQEGLEVSMNSVAKSFVVHAPRQCGKTTWLAKEFHKRQENALWTSGGGKRYLQEMFDSKSYIASMDLGMVGSSVVVFGDEVLPSAQCKCIVVCVISEE